MTGGPQTVNTSAKGAAYENAYKRRLLNRKGMIFVARAAASKGRFDLISLDADQGEWTFGLWQLKSGRLSCHAAHGLMMQLWSDLGMPPSWVPFSVNVVHRTKDREFCEH